ncbi:hypothetical protein [Thiorhodococcus mannitoliphagus]|nr:hypothetical protein [Thiorhodococcus mannitoliphagus]
MDTNDIRAIMHPHEDDAMDYGVFKGLQAVLFFGSAMAFCLWQLAAIRRLRREPSRATGEASQPESATPSAEGQ